MLACTVAAFSDTTSVAGASAGTVVPGARLGLYGAGAINFSDANVQVWQLPVGSTQFLGRFANDSLRFTEGSTGVTFVGGGLLMFPINRMWHVGGRVGVNWLNASSTFTQAVAQDSLLRHEWSASNILIEISPTLEIHDLFPVPLYLLAGLEFGIPISASRQQTTFLDTNGTEVLQEITTGAADVPGTSVRSAVIMGAGYTIELGKKVWLQPEISYRLPLTDVSSDATHSPWKIGQLRIGVNLTFGLGSDPAPPEPERTKASARMDPVTARDATGREFEVQNVTVEDVTYTEMFPLVPYVFYPENSGTPDANMQNTDYRNERGEFVPEKLELDAMQVNRNLLNIVGARMQKIPQSTLTITGTADGRKEDGKGALPSQRAAWAKDYLVNSFKIDASRIAVRSIAAPVKPSSITDPDGVAENRRAELTSNVPDVLEPLVITADNQRVATPDVMMFHPVVDGSDSVDKWVLSITQAGRPLRELSGQGKPGAVTWALKPNELSTAQVPVDYMFTATTTDGQKVEASGSMPVDYLSSVQKRTENLPDRMIDKYSLILFDFDKATLTEDNKRILERMVLPSIKVNSKVSIIGYTDRIGTEEHNKKLSADRSKTVMDFLKGRATDATYSAVGVGESSEIYNNNSPVGRQLSRTVQVIVETKK
jgi:outer membrane protein OmpA-like peptidoglycan-associated protein